MRKYALLVVGLLVLASPAVRAEQPQGKLVEDSWEVLKLHGSRVGSFHVVTREFDVKGGKVLRTTARLDMTLKRAGATTKISAENGTDETTDGKVVGISFRMAQGGGDLVQVGTLEAKGLHLKINGGRIDKFVPWDGDVIGLYRQDRICKDKKVKVGDSFTFKSYEPSITSVVTMHGKVSEAEEVATAKGKQKLPRVELVSDPIVVRKAGSEETFKLQLPKMVFWLDKDMMPVRRQYDMPGIGTIVQARADRETATAPVETVLDLLENTRIVLNRTIQNPYATRSAVYRITVKDDDDPTTALAQDARQKIEHAKGNSFELHVKAVRNPVKVDKPDAPAKKEFRTSCYYINSDDALVKKDAAQAIGDETDPLKKARLVERWVHRHMENDNEAPFAPSDQIARSMKGDCRLHALLTAAMCRAADVPSRTAVGLVYATDRKPGSAFLAYHMWTEVWVRGQWLAIDATLGQGSIGATHIKIADQSWYDTQSLTPLLAVARVLDKLKVEVISVNGDE